MISLLLKDGCIMAAFGERLRYLREEKGLKQTELAKMLDLGSSATISQYENVALNRIPDAHILKKIADILDCSTDYLLCRTSNRKEIIPGPTLDEEIIQIMQELGPDITLQFYDLKGITDDEKENLKIFLQGLKARRGQREEER
jgi:transcriptional regulator with XRE-family HTH domain